ncbi:MAG: helix-turn-helix transcriptional regulator [Bacteroidales bacterium]|nr:helix-turn-helix transcriptional regulator [Bacteroidales bacterium]
MDNESIKKNIMKLRLEHNLSQGDMADALGVARNTYRSVEKGNTRMISDTVLEVAKWAGITPEEVVLGFKPDEAISQRLKDARAQFNDRVKGLTEEYEARLDGLRKEIDLLKDLIKEKDDNIRNLKSLVALLEKGQEEYKND